MAITTGPKIPVMASGASGDKFLTQGNAMLHMLQALVQPNVISIGATGPAGSPSNGDTYVIGATGATGAWVGEENAVAYWAADPNVVPGGQWEFYSPIKGWTVGNQDDGNLYVYSGTTWSAIVVPGAISGSGIIPLGSPIYTGTVSQDGSWGSTTFTRIPGSMLSSFPSPWKMSFFIEAFESPGGSVTFNSCVVARTARNSRIVLDTTPVQFGGTSSPTFNVLGEQTSDAINLALDGNHDYWFLFYAPFVGGNDVSLTFCDYTGFKYLQGLEGGMFAGDQTAAGTLPATMDGPRQTCIFLTRWVAA